MRALAAAGGAQVLVWAFCFVAGFCAGLGSVLAARWAWRRKADRATAAFIAVHGPGDPDAVQRFARFVAGPERHP